MLSGKNIVIGVCGGIAAYKALDVISNLKKMGANIDVIMTSNAAEFVTPLSFQSLSQNPVVVSMFDSPKSWETEHISLAKKADIFLIVPASANILGKVANGIADDMLSTTIMATRAPVLFAPAMNTNMYENSIVQANIKKLKEYGYIFIEPEFGRLACGDTGRGKLAKVNDIVDVTARMLYDKKDLTGYKVLVTAGPTIEPIDPVRYITNHSSGRMGYAIAECARNRGAEVVLVSGPTSLEPVKGVEYISVNTNKEMYDAIMDQFESCNVIIKAAAVADYSPSEYSREKIKKNDEELLLKLKKNTDILLELGKIKKDKILVGFAAESSNLLENAKNKIIKKNLDLIVANDITNEGSGFKSDKNKAFLIDRDGRVTELPLMSKLCLSDIILDRVRQLLK